MSEAGLLIEAVAEVTSDLVQALASLMPQLNAALVGPTSEELSSLLADPATTLLAASEEGFERRESNVYRLTLG